MAGLEPGTVIWIERDSVLEPRRILVSQGGTLQVQDPSGEEERLSVKRVVFISAVARGRIGSPAALASHRDEVAARHQVEDLGETWELMVDEGMSEVTPEELAELLYGDPGPASMDGLRISLEEGTPWFKRLKNGAVRVQPRAVVEERLRQEARTAARQRELEALSASFIEAAAGRGALSPEAEAELDMIQRVAATGDIPVRADRIICGIYPESRKSVPELAFRLMVELGRWDEHQDLNLMALGIPRPFSAAAQAEVQALLAGPMPSRMGTGELPRDLFTVAIDDASTREVDDALGIEVMGEDMLLHVIIADVAAWICAGSALDEEARERSATIYHPAGNHAMLPTELSYGPMSLAAGEPRRGLDIQLLCAPDGGVTSIDVVPVELVLSRRATYEEADEILGRPVDDAPLSRTLHRLHDLATRLREQRIKAGAVVFQRQEFKVRVQEGGAVTVRKLPQNSPAQILVSECMIAASAGAGHLVDEHSADGIFRVQKRPDDEIQYDPDKASDPVWLQQNIRKLKRVEFSLSPGPHAALGVDSYCQVTSPLRRYADLVMQRQIVALATSGVPVLSAEDLGEVTAHLETTGLGINRAQSAAIRYWTTAALQEHLNEETEAVVVDEQGRGLVIELTDWGLRARLHPNMPHRVGDRISVRVVEADPRGERLVVRDVPAEEE